MNFGQFVDKATSVQFLAGGRNWDGWDCWGLVRTAYQDVRNTTLPMHSDDHRSIRHLERLEELMRAGAAFEGWEKISERDAQPMDALLLILRGRACHIGLVVDPRRRLFLHAEEDAGTTIEQWNRLPWRGGAVDRVEGFYAHRNGD